MAIAPGSGVIMIAPVSVCHQVSTIGQRSSPMTSRYHIHASGLIGSPTVPSRRRLSQVVLLGHSLAPLDESANRRGRGVEDGDLVAFDDLPEAIGLGKVRRAFVHQRRRAVLQRPVNDVAVARDPSDVGSAPVHIVFLQIEDPFRGDVGSDRIAAGRVHNALRLAGRAGGVKDVERMFGIERLGWAIWSKPSPSDRATSDRVRPSC